MSVINRDLVFLIIQFLKEEGYREAAHKLEFQSGLYFDMEYFEGKVLSGEWEEAENYLSGFTRLDENRHSMKVFFELRKQRYYEALDSNNRDKAVDILMKDLKVFEPGHEELYSGLASLLTLNNIREHKDLSTYQDTITARVHLKDEVKKIITANPLFAGKLAFPAIPSRRLRCLLNQSLNWQHILCREPLPDPFIESLYVDHVCRPPRNPANPQSVDNNSPPRSGPPLSESGNLSASNVVDPETAEQVRGDSINISKRKCSEFGDEVSSSTYETCKVVLEVKEDSLAISMDFHPIQHTVLLVGTEIGSIGLWDVSSGEKLLSNKFAVWDIGARSDNFKEALEKDSCVSVKRIMWSPDGSIFGVAFSKHIVQLYSYLDRKIIEQHLELEAHNGSVNDLAFCSVNPKLLAITCGDDKTVKVWDANTGNKNYTFEDHQAPVYSICPHVKINAQGNPAQFIISTSVDGVIMARLYDGQGARVDHGAPGGASMKMVYSTDDKRLFSCGSGLFREPYLLEWDETEGTIIRTYKGLKQPCFSPLHFDTTLNRILAVGDEYKVKFWDINIAEVWKTTNANGDLLANPCIRFNKEGTLLAATAKENKIKIFATDFSPLLPESETSKKPRCEEGLENERSSEIETSKCQFLQLPVYAEVNKIVGLTYTNAGEGILALASNGVHLVWKWEQNDLNLEGKATTKVAPQLSQPRSVSQLMKNEVVESVNPEDQISCFALSKNDSYLMSASGGIVSLYNIKAFKTVATIMPPPPAATCLALHPQDNNILAVAMSNSSIIIYNVHTKDTRKRLKGHSRRVTSLAFSGTLNVLVSADVDAQIIVWNVNGWVKQKDRHLEIRECKRQDRQPETHVQFHKDQIHFISVRDSHLAIYEATELRCVKQWIPGVSEFICHATFSCDGERVFAALFDGTLAIFDGLNLEVLCRIDPTTYLLARSSLGVYPRVMAAHPQKAAQFAVGFSDGSVFVFEPQEERGKWSLLPYDDSESGKPMLQKSQMNREGKRPIVD